jgi:ATP-binding cassette subfamily C (CFTR/MRP) protein 1
MHDDAEIWSALRSAHLKDYISNMENKLSAPVLQGGENFSVGQRQVSHLCADVLSVLTIDRHSSSVWRERFCDAHPS